MTTETVPEAFTGAAARRAARNAGAITAARIVSSAVQFLWQLILIHALGDAGFGVYGAVGALFAIGVTITAFSMSLIVIRDVARRPDSAGRYLSATLAIQTVLALVAYVGINAAASAYDDVIRGFVAVAGISLFIDALGTMCYDQLLAQERMVTTSLVEVAHIVVRIGLAGLALSAGFGLLGVYVITILTGIGRSALLWALLRRTGVRPQFPVDWSVARPLLINSAPLALAAFINITYGQIDKLLTAGLLTNADTGHLNAAFVIIYGVIEILSTTVLVAIYPMMSRTFRTDGQNNATFRFMVEKLSFFTLLIGLPVGLLFSLFAAAIIVPLFGMNYVATAAILRVLIWYAVVTMIVNVFAQALYVQNRQRFLVGARIGGLAIKLTLSLFLLPRIGVTGAALATVGSEILVLLVLAGDFHLDMRILLPRLARLAGIALIAALAMLALDALHPILGMVVGVLVYAGGILIARVLAADDWDLLYRLAAAMPGGSLILRYWHRAVELNW